MQVSVISSVLSFTGKTCLKVLITALFVSILFYFGQLYKFLQSRAQVFLQSESNLGWCLYLYVFPSTYKQRISFGIMNCIQNHFKSSKHQCILVFAQSCQRKHFNDFVKAPPSVVFLQQRIIEEGSNFRGIEKLVLTLKMWMRLLWLKFEVSRTLLLDVLGQNKNICEFDQQQKNNQHRMVSLEFVDKGFLVCSKIKTKF